MSDNEITTNIITVGSDEEFADKRQDEIVLDHALAKSSNVTTPEEARSSFQNGSSSTAADATLSRQETTLTQADEDQPKNDNSYALNPLSLPSKRQQSANLEDDFFSMSYGLPVISFDNKKQKKKKKKKVKRTASEEPQHNLASKESSVDSTALVSGNKGIAPDSEVVLIEDDDDDSHTPRFKKRKLTPPPFSEDEIRKSIQLSRMAAQSYQSTVDDELYLDDFEDQETQRRLARLAQYTEKMSTQITRSGTTDSVDSDEAPKEYLLNITSFLPGSENVSLEVALPGGKRFKSVINKTLKYLLGSQDIPDYLQHIYSPEYVVLLYDEIEILDFMRPDKLGIKGQEYQEQISVSLGIYTKNQAENVKREKRLAKIARMNEFAKEEELERKAREEIQADEEYVDPFQDDEEFKEVDKQVMETSAASREASAVQQNEDDAVNDEGYFKIVLKGEDNVKLTVKVNAETQLSKLVEYYLKKKNLPSNTKVRLVFDDEDLEIDQAVGDTELEEDFTVDVYMVK